MAELFAAIDAGLAGDEQTMTAWLAAAQTRPDAPTEVTALGPMVHALPHLLRHSLETASALLDEAVPALLAHGSAIPIDHIGLWALLRTAVGDRDAAAREHLRGHKVLAAIGQPGRARSTPTRSRRAGPGARPTPPPSSPPPTPRSRTCRGGTGSCGCSRWKARSSTAGATRCPPCAPTSPPTRPRARRAWPAPAATCCARPARRPAAKRARWHPALRARGVTAREAEVLALVAAGLTNAEAAAAAVPVRRTVETHVARLLAKTGAADRSELRRWA